MSTIQGYEVTITRTFTLKKHVLATDIEELRLKIARIEICTSLSDYKQEDTGYDVTRTEEVEVPESEDSEDGVMVIARQILHDIQEADSYEDDDDEDSSTMEEIDAYIEDLDALTDEEKTYRAEHDHLVMHDFQVMTQGYCTACMLRERAEANHSN